MELLDKVFASTFDYMDAMPKKERKRYGQFFTSKETAVFMASLFAMPQNVDKITVLDPGAGSGVLSAALLERIAKTGIKEVELTCYENDANVLPLLEKNLIYMQSSVNFKLTYRINTNNYITSQRSEFNGELGCEYKDKYDLVIGNPPYKKIGKDAAEALSMPEVCHGAPNLYFLFTAMSLFNVKDDGEIVYIIPRSWTSGAYFTAFRKYLFAFGKLEHIHLFVSRSKVFEQESVLQETLVIKVKKTHIKPDYVRVTSSNSNKDFTNIDVLDVPYELVVSGKMQYVYLVTNETELETISKLHSFTKTLPDIGLKMKTGLTVDFREREFLKNQRVNGAVPLFFAQHIKCGRVEFPKHLEGEYLVGARDGLVQKNSNYLFVKRFTSKEEKRRLQCGIYLAKHFDEYSVISTQNKLNFIDNAQHNLAESTVYGLYVLFNSALYDEYYRMLNGSTQVNSSEVNSMPVPDLKTINMLGNRLLKARNLSEETCEEILEDILDDEQRTGQKVS